MPESLPKPFEAGAVGGMGVDGDGDGRGAEDGDEVEGVDDVAEGEVCPSGRRHRDGHAGVEEAGVGIEDVDALERREVATVSTLSGG